MAFKAVDPDKTGLTKEVRAEDRVKVEGPTVTLPTKTLYVVDPDRCFDVHTTEWEHLQDVISRYAVGEIEYPLDFCPMDSGFCAAGNSVSGTAGFQHHGGGAGDRTEPELWYHVGCFRPTRAWFTGHVRSVVKFYGNVPW